MKKLSIFLLFFFSFPLLGETTTDTSVVVKQSINLKEVFLASPIIYGTLFVFSLACLSLWLFTILTFKKETKNRNHLSSKLQKFIREENFLLADELCKEENELFTKMIRVAISSRNHGLQTMHEMMKTEGRRATQHLWQRISLLNDVAVLSPMFGLVGTVIGMFYAFYDIHRSAETLYILFDGLGISVGTTVAGLLVSIFVMILSTTLKYRISHVLNHIEDEAYLVTNLIQTKKTL